MYKLGIVVFFLDDAASQDSGQVIITFMPLAAYKNALRVLSASVSPLFFHSRLLFFFLGGHWHDLEDFIFHSNELDFNRIVFGGTEIGIASRFTVEEGCKRFIGVKCVGLMSIRD